MKRFVSIILGICLCFSISACSSSPDEEDVRGEQITNNDVQEDEMTNGPEFSLGKTDGLKYENTFIGIGCTLNSGWYFYTDEEIRELNNITEELAGEDFIEAVKDADIIYDMYAISDNQLDNVNVNLQKVDDFVLEQLDIKVNFENTIPEAKKAFENMGYTDLEFEIMTTQISGEDVLCLKTTGVIDGLTMYQKIISFKCDGYFSNVTITTYQEDNVDEVLEQFYFVKNI